MKGSITNAWHSPSSVVPKMGGVGERETWRTMKLAPSRYPIAWDYENTIGTMKVPLEL